MKKDKRGNVISWKSKSNSPILDGYERSKRVATISKQSQPLKAPIYNADGRGYLTLEESMVEVGTVSLTSTYSFACVTFKVLGDDLEQYIVSNWQDHQDHFVFRGISVSKNEIRIHGCVNGDKDYFSITHDASLWTTLFVEWTENDLHSRSHESVSHFSKQKFHKTHNDLDDLVSFKQHIALDHLP